MATTCKLIAKNVLGSDTATVTFSSIPATYTDLLLVCSVRSARSGQLLDNMKVRFNAAANDNNHSVRWLEGNGSSASSSSDTFEGLLGYLPAATATADSFASCEIYLPNYAGSTNKPYSVTNVMENNATAARIVALAGLWSSTNAINEVKLLSTTASNFTSGSSFYLYGITKA
jgi:hypothetical protein